MANEPNDNPARPEPTPMSGPSAPTAAPSAPSPSSLPPPAPGPLVSEPSAIAPGPSAPEPAAFARNGECDDRTIAVRLKRTAKQQFQSSALFAALSKSVNATSFKNYAAFMDTVMLGREPRVFCCSSGSTPTACSRRRPRCS